MKKKHLMAGLIIAAVLLMILPINAFASTYSGAWDPNSTDPVIIFEITPGTQDAWLYMYDWNNTDSMMVIEDAMFAAANVFFTQDSSDIWHAGLTSGAKTLNLGNSTRFGFYFSDGLNKNTSYVLTTITGGSQYRLRDNQGSSKTKMDVIVNFAAPVPIPATVWILGAGLLGLVGIRRKLKS